MEYSLTFMEKTKIKIKASLNPCCNGILPDKYDKGIDKISRKS